MDGYSRETLRMIEENNDTLTEYVTGIILSHVMLADFYIK